MNLDGDALADRELIDPRPEPDDRAHVFVAGRQVLVERQSALDHRRRAVIDVVEVGGADGDRVDPQQHLRSGRHRDGLLRQDQLSGIAQHPRLHGFGDREIPARGHSGRHVHPTLLKSGAMIRDPESEAEISPSSDPLHPSPFQGEERAVVAAVSSIPSQNSLSASPNLPLKGGGRFASANRVGVNRRHDRRDDARAIPSQTLYPFRGRERAVVAAVSSVPSQNSLSASPNLPRKGGGRFASANRVGV